MLSLDFELLTGRYIATTYNDRQEPEWPPHPARVFSALVATALEIADPDPAELDALRWLEALPPPAIAASAASRRDTVTVFVPVNDTTVTRDRDIGLPKNAPTKGMIEKGIKVMPGARTRQPRTFPSVRPESARFSLIWADANPGAHRDPLDRLARRVVRVGHSSSFVAARVGTGESAPTWRPTDDGPLSLRTTGPGQLDRLQEDFAVHKATTPRVLPARFQAYAPAHSEDAAGELPRPCFGQDWVVLRRSGGARLPIMAAPALARAVRGAIMRYADQPPAEVISGHLPDGRPTPRPHLAYAPLPFVAHPHADGHLLGIALVLPVAAENDARRAVWRAVGRWEASHRLDGEERPTLPARLGRAGVVELERVGWERPAHSLRAANWCRPARRWVSVTPVALDHNPGNLNSRDPQIVARAWEKAEADIADACEHIGLPAPTRVQMHPSVPVTGSAKARSFGPFPPGRGRTRRVLVHASITFKSAVRGPLLLGAGRFVGLGLFRPLES